MDISKDLVAASATPLVLAILADGDSYDYAIIEPVGELSGGQLRWTGGMLYPVLHRLERPAAPVIPHHTDGTDPLGDSAAAMAGGGRHAARNLAEGHPGARSRIARTTKKTERPMAIRDDALEAQIAEWRTYLGRRPAIRTSHVEELGENLILLINLAWSAWLYARFLGGRGPFSALERWQTDYLPVYAVWAGFVVVAFPPLFGYL